ncbi:hypothetical protein [Flavobacterium sp.]|jgi:hypothetical protein|uniref:hypothetical protein n=1 Tax=Flavobacterium sp. TaxID=239 RepID=UPI0037C06520
MKYIYLLLAVGFLTVSCEPKFDEPTETLETLPVSQVTIPVKYAKDSITEIQVQYIRPTVCHSFYDFYYERSGLNRTVAIIAFKQNGGTACPPSQLSYTAILKFKPANLGTYHFKFWTSTDAQGVDQFIEYDAIVNH